MRPRFKYAAHLGSAAGSEHTPGRPRPRRAPFGVPSVSWYSCWAVSLSPRSSRRTSSAPFMLRSAFVFRGRRRSQVSHASESPPVFAPRTIELPSRTEPEPRCLQDLEGLLPPVLLHEPARRAREDGHAAHQREGRDGLDDRPLRVASRRVGAAHIARIDRAGSHRVRRQIRSCRLSHHLTARTTYT